MPSDLEFQRKPKHVLVRRPNTRTRDGFYTIGKIVSWRGPGRWRDKLPTGWHLNLNENITLEEMADIYLVMAEMTEQLEKKKLDVM